jgi:hypothetical protein
MTLSLFVIITLLLQRLKEGLPLKMHRNYRSVLCVRDFRFSVMYSGKFHRSSRHFAERNVDEVNIDYSDSNTINLEKTFTFQDLPDETIYIMDGTSMLHNAYFSRERQLDWGSAVLSPAKSAAVIQKLGLAVDSGDGKLDATAASDVAIDEENSPLLIGEDGAMRVRCGTLTAMLMHFSRFVRDVKPKYLAVAFDAGKLTFRNELYEPYKQQRSAVGKGTVDVIPQSASIPDIVTTNQLHSRSLLHPAPQLLIKPLTTAPALTPSRSPMSLLSLSLRQTWRLCSTWLPGCCRCWAAAVCSSRATRPTTSWPPSRDGPGTGE